MPWRRGPIAHECTIGEGESGEGIVKGFALFVGLVWHQSLASALVFPPDPPNAAFLFWHGGHGRPSHSGKFIPPNVNKALAYKHMRFQQRTKELS